jgi:hypothetical protein
VVRKTINMPLLKTTGAIRNASSIGATSNASSTDAIRNAS